MKKLNSYKNTSVNWAKSQAQIGKLLDQVGVRDVRFTFMQSQKSIICEFNYPSELEGKAVTMGVRIVTKLKESKNEEQEKNRVHRILFNKLKSRFLEIQEDTQEFVRVFMADLIVFDKKGNSTTMAQVILPQYNKGLITGEQKDILMIGNS
jgi:hypothetical protein